MIHNDIHIHWVSPVPPAPTDIAQYTIRVAKFLSKHCNLTLWTDTKNWDPKYEDICPIRYLNPDQVTPRSIFSNSIQNPNAKNIIFINVGNSWVFHSGYLRMAIRIPSIIILHDLYVWELFREAILNGKFPLEIFLRSMTKWHPNTFKKMDDGHAYPCFEPCLDKAVAVLTHSIQAFDAVSELRAVPTYHLDLPYNISPTAEHDESLRTGPLRFLQFGYIGGPNRRLEQVLEALATVKDEIDFHFDVMGNIWDVDRISLLISELKMNHRVTLHGYVNDEKLNKALSEADLVFNLRYPTMGEASGSQLRVWNAKAASVVSNVGWYSNLPNNTVFKISVDNEISEIVSLIKDISSNRNITFKIGINGNNILRTYHCPDLYAEAIMEIAKRHFTESCDELRARTTRMVLPSVGKQSQFSKNLMAKYLSSHDLEVK